MGNLDKISEEYGAELCEIAFRIWAGWIELETDLFEVEVWDWIFFYQYLYNGIAPHWSFFDDLDSIIKNWAILTHFRHWAEEYQEFKI